jgi:hypothetical protein
MVERAILNPLPCEVETLGRRRANAPHVYCAYAWFDGIYTPFVSLFPSTNIL